MVYRNMKTRCYNQNSPDYNNYGRRRITVCKEWLNDSKAFFTWSYANGYREGLSLDRIDNNKGYSPDNCRWTTRKIQQNNTRSNHYVTYKGKTKTVKQWCEELSLNYGTVIIRLNKYHWTAEETFETKVRGKAKRLNNVRYKGKTQSLKDWCQELNLRYDTVYHRLIRGWSLEKALELN